MKDVLVTQVVSFVTGIIVNLLFSLIIWFTLIFFPKVDWLLGVGILILQWIYFGYTGIGNVPIGFQGNVIVLGARTRILFGEGWYWVFRPFMRIESIEVREITLEISTRSEHASKAGVESSGIITEDRVEMVVDASIQYRVCDARLFQSLGPSVVTNGLRDVVITSAGKVAEKTLAEAFMVNKKVVEQRARTNARKQANRWGVEIIKINIKRIAPLRANVQEANEQIVIEELQQQSEGRENRNLVARIEELKAVGLSVQDAQAASQTERGKLTRTRNDNNITITGDTGSIVAATVAGANAFTSSNKAQNQGSGKQQQTQQPPHQKKKKGKQKP